MPGYKQVMLGHGSGGSMMRRIIDDVFLSAYGSEELAVGDDAAVLELPMPMPCEESCDLDYSTCANPLYSGAIFPNDANAGARLAFSTDSFVVTPHFFPGGDIGRLAVCGTVNDVATSGAVPKWISCSMILEEGFPMDDLKRICESISECAKEAGVCVVTGDTKVVNKGSADGIFINTSGIGILGPGTSLGGANCKPGDKVLITGSVGDHGITVMSCREGLSFQADIQSDAAPLNHLVRNVLEAAPNVRCFRDPTRGGLASTLNELALQSHVDFLVEESEVPVKPQVLGACEMLGYDVMQVANEGKMVCVVAPDEAQAALDAMKTSRYGEDAAIIGEVQEMPDDQRGPKVFLQTAFGARRILDMLVGEQLPRIC